MEKKNTDKDYSHILKYTGVFGGVQGLNILVSVARTKFAALLLGPAGMGLVSLFNSAVNMMVSASSFGIPISGVQELSDKYNSKDVTEIENAVKMIRSWSLVTGLLGTILCVLFSSLLNRWTFTWGNHTLHFVLLSPVVGMSIVAGGEIAILKATRQLRALAFTSLQVIVASLVVSVPVYYLWGQSGVVAVLVLQALVQLVCAIHYSTRYYSYHSSFRLSYLRGGLHIVRLGVAFVIAGIMSSGVEFLIRTYLNNVSELDEIGLFNAGCTLALVYAGLVFSAMESDYFPRLSAIKEKGEEQNACVNKQVDVNVLLVTPCLLMMVFGLPILIPLLYDSSFNGMLQMAQFATVSMLFRAVYLPIEYLPLAKGESKVFLVQEAFAAILLITFEIAGYELKGLTGLGMGIALAYCLEMLAVMAYSRFCYAYKVSRRTMGFVGIQAFFVFVSLSLALSGLQGVWYWGVAVVCTLLDAAITLYIIQRKTDVFDLLRAKLRK